MFLNMHADYWCNFTWNIIRLLGYFLIKLTNLYFLYYMYKYVYQTLEVKLQFQCSWLRWEIEHINLTCDLYPRLWQTRLKKNRKLVLNILFFFFFLKLNYILGANLFWVIDTVSFTIYVFFLLLCFSKLSVWISN